MVFRKVLKHHFVGALKSESAFHKCCLWWVSPTDLPKEKQQVRILSAASSPPSQHIGTTEPLKSTDHEPLTKDMSMFIPDLFIRVYGTQQCWRNISTYAQDLRHPFQMLHRRLRILLQSWARNRLRKCKSDSSIIQIYQSTPLHYWGRCTTRNLLRLKDSLSFSRKYLKWITDRSWKVVTP